MCCRRQENREPALPHLATASMSPRTGFHLTHDQGRAGKNQGPVPNSKMRSTFLKNRTINKIYEIYYNNIYQKSTRCLNRELAVYQYATPVPSRLPSTSSSTCSMKCSNWSVQPLGKQSSRLTCLCVPAFIPRSSTATQQPRSRL
ncbi:hypothetical protein SEVIR_8G103932v4 [Setaria viridis]